MKFFSGLPTLTNQDKFNIAQIAIILPIVLLCIPTSFNRRKELKNDLLPNPLILLWAFIPFVLIYALRVLCIEHIFPKLGDKFIFYKSYWEPGVREFRVKRFALVLFKAIYFWISAPLGILLFRYEDWMPSALFGKGKQDLELLWENFPYQEQSPMLSVYYCWALGYHFHSLVFHMQSEKRNDYFENLLHHVATVFLIIFSFCNNCGRIGVLVLILHDIVDAIMYMSKSVNDMPNQVPVYCGFAFIAISFFQFRIFTLGYHIIPAAVNAKNYIPDGIPGSYIVFYLLVGLLCVLWVLHAYWFYLIIQIIVVAIKNKGRLKDPHALG
ncbi:protein ASC1, putative [Entamoeba dispar SAW760]|uniref:Protein ASC1, putative n=1 Tax=Entamoeba dispar (strain ATCC PRA-260 / SAW760) TaxID=370354 RepID=B0EFR3_ENTDS|nr:protein ASC1, putative [Entamoeba dispar SAW760]EDR26635.1 protein ASC1, putative [Entamoeba dispar SAW760]|eukprot:EDR26635.1 protein ASC1, putative [Entamoeba dispar SAW760]